MDSPALASSVAYYAARMISQYRALPKAQATIAILVKQALGDMLALTVQSAFDLDTAIGAQLDIIGKYVGLSRNIGPSTAKPYYGLENYNATGNPIGFQRYGSSSNPQGIWLRYAQGTDQNTALADDSYRLAIKVRICQLYNNGTNGSIQSYLQAFWPGRVIVLSDIHNHSLEYFVPAAFPLPLSVWQILLPRPLGMAITVATY